MANLNSTGSILNELHNVQALLEAVKAQLCVEDHDQLLRVLHVASDRLAESINALDELSVTLPDSAKIDPGILAIKRYVESDGKSR